MTLSLSSWLRWGRRRPIEDEAPVLDTLLTQSERADGDADRVDWVRNALRWIGQDIGGAHDETAIAPMRAVDISPLDRALVYRAIRQCLTSRPLEFLWPPRARPGMPVPDEAH